MRILLVSDYYPPFIGGAHRQSALVARFLAERGHEVEVATLWHAGFPRREQDGAVPVHRVRQLRSVGPLGRRPGQRHQPAFPDPVTSLALRRIVRRFRPDVVHAYGGISFSAAVALLGTEIPLVLVARDYGYGCPTRTLVRNGAICDGPALRRCLSCSAGYYGLPKGIAATLGLRASQPILRRRLRAVISVSSYVRDTVRRDFAHDAALPDAVIPSFRERDDLAPAEGTDVVRRLDAIGEPFILFVGALRGEKGIAELLGAYRRIDGAPPLVLVGTRERDTPPTMPPGVTVIEQATITEVVAAWDRALFGVLPSRWPEPLGSVVYEGMSRGRAVIGTRPGGHVDMIEDGESGLLVAAGDEAALEEAMRRLIDDPALRERLGRAARERAARFTAGESIPAIEGLLATVVAGGRA